MTAGASPLVFFVHMQKTAGTTLYVRLRRHFGDEAVYPTSSDQRAHKASIHTGLLLRRLGELPDTMRVIAGHFPLCVTEMVDRPFTTITVLRDPVERTLSALRDVRERDPRFEGWPLEKVYEDPIFFPCVIENHMVKMLAIRPEELTDGMLTPLEFHDGHLERAITALHERIDAWGLQEDFESFCDELTQRFGWDLGPPRVTNASRPGDVADDFRERIARDNEFDVELYRHALALHQQRSGRPRR
jgi:hypothetical protein